MDARTSNATEIDSRPTNNLLRRLSHADYALLAPPITFDTAGASELLYNPGDDVQDVHFPSGPSLAAFLVPTGAGGDVENILVAREGAVGGIVSADYQPAYARKCV